MNTRFTSGESPIYEYPDDVPSMHPPGACDGTCAICVAQQLARATGRAKVIGTMKWSGAETHSTLRRSFLDRLLGRPGRWVED